MKAGYRVYFTKGAVLSEKFLKKIEEIKDNGDYHCEIEYIDVLDPGQLNTLGHIKVTPSIKKMFPLPEDQYCGELVDLESWIGSHFLSTKNESVA